MYESDEVGNGRRTTKPSPSTARWAGIRRVTVAVEADMILLRCMRICCYHNN